VNTIWVIVIEKHPVCCFVRVALKIAVIIAVADVLKTRVKDDFFSGRQNRQWTKHNTAVH